MSDRNSHPRKPEPILRNTVVYETRTTCANIKSRKEPGRPCTNPATTGAYCGIHAKKPIPFVRGVATFRKVRRLNRLSQKKVEMDARDRIGRWLLQRIRRRNVLRGGLAFYVRDQMVNDADFFSMDSLRSLSLPYFVSCVEANQLYGFDLRSLYTILHRARAAEEIPLNPYTRSPIPPPFVRHVEGLAAALETRGIAVSWAPLDPLTPEQQARMRIVDLFALLNELNYYCSPEWFFSLDAAGHRRLYTELHAIWSVRAGLTDAQKAVLVPSYSTRLFRLPPHATVELTLDALQRLLATTIRLFISAEDANDRISGAMHVVSAFTLVNADARTAYPWLYDSVYEPPPPPRPAFAWLFRLWRGGAHVFVPPLEQN